MGIAFNTQGIKFELKRKLLYKQWVKKIAEQEGRGVGEINYIFCSDDYLLEMNRTYLEHDTYTDIITFDYGEGNSKISGDLYISIDRVGENAKKFNATFDDELRRVMIHGIFHLSGYPDKKPQEAKIMRRKENEALKCFNSLAIRD